MRAVGFGLAQASQAKHYTPLRDHYSQNLSQLTWRCMLHWLLFLMLSNPQKCSSLLTNGTPGMVPAASLYITGDTGNIGIATLDQTSGPTCPYSITNSSHCTSCFRGRYPCSYGITHSQEKFVLTLNNQRLTYGFTHGWKALTCKCSSVSVFPVSVPDEASTCSGNIAYVTIMNALKCNA